MPRNHVHYGNRPVPLSLRQAPDRLVVCSVCLRVRDGSAWIEPDEVIRRLRTFEREGVVRLAGALCERCQTELRARRQGDSNELAA